jgi:hypothetical protein
MALKVSGSRAGHNHVKQTKPSSSSEQNAEVNVPE